MKAQKQSTSTHQNTQSRDSANPEKSLSIRKAAARLKEKQAQIDIIKKRFLVLKGQQQYNRYRTLDQQKRIKHHNALHQSIKIDKSSLQKRLRIQREIQEQQLKEKHDKMLLQLRENSKDIHSEMIASRISQSAKLKEQSKINEMIIDRNKKEALEQNNKRKQTITNEQKKQIANVKQYKNTHARQTIGNRSMEASRLTQLTDSKDRQLQRLMAYEQQMLRKASQSIAMNNKLKTQFGRVFVQVKQKNNFKLPSIATRQTGSYRANQSSISRNISIYEI